MIELHAVAKQFLRPGSSWRGRSVPVHAVCDVSWQAQDAQITGLLGPNGAGKTTTLRMLAGLVQPDAGTIEVDGRAVAQQPQWTAARLGVLSDAQGIYPRLSARENILYYARLRGLPDEQAQARLDTLAGLLDIRPLLDRRTQGFSQGERLKTALARALIHDPPNIVLDEPTNGLDVLATRALRDTLRLLRSPQGGSKCIILSTHIMQEVAQLCDHVVVMSQGRSVAQGSVTQLQAQTGHSHFEDCFVHLAFANTSTPP